MSNQIKVKDQLDTVLMAFHLYKKDADKFKDLCRKAGKFHSEVLRLFITAFNDYEGREFKFSYNYKPLSEGLLIRLARSAAEKEKPTQ